MCPRDTIPDATNPPCAARRVHLVLAVAALATGGCRTTLEDAPACADIRVLDDTGMLASFDTRTLRFTDLARLRCAARTGIPASLAVARDGTTWVFYSDGELFRVAPETGACSRTAFDDRALPHFGPDIVVLRPAFSADAPGSASESLFAAVGHPEPHFPEPGTDVVFRLQTLNLERFQLSDIGPLKDAHALVGTPDAELWTVGHGLIARVDKRTGGYDRTIPFDTGPIDTGQAIDWSAAFSRGAFWIFTRSFVDRSSPVLRVEELSGAVTAAVPEAGRKVLYAAPVPCAQPGM